MASLETTVKSLLLPLVAAKQEFCVVGDLAALAYGVRRPPGSIEIAVREVNVDPLIEFLYKNGYQLEAIVRGGKAFRLPKVEHAYRLTRHRDSVLLAEGSSVLACVTPAGKVRRIPESVYPALK